jgi:hypothetical protein
MDGIHHAPSRLLLLPEIWLSIDKTTPPILIQTDLSESAALVSVRRDWAQDTTAIGRSCRHEIP